MKKINSKLTKLSQQNGKLIGGFLPLETSELVKLRGGNNCSANNICPNRKPLSPFSK
jgi:hypothetical protein